MTVRRMVDAFMADAEGRLKPSTLALYRADADALCSVFGGEGVDRVSSLALSAWLATWKAGPTSKAIRIRSLSAVWGWAVKHGLATANPLSGVPRPKGRTRSREAVIPDADHDKLLAVASPAFRQVLRVLHATGCRPGEACRITAQNFDPANAVAVLDEHKADTTGRPRLVFLPPDVCNMLRELAERYPSGPLLRNERGNPWTRDSIVHAKRRGSKAAGVKAIAYGYRHTFATTALVRGVPDSTVAALLGHTSTAMVHKHYSHLSSQAQTKREALARVRG